MKVTCNREKLLAAFQTAAAVAPQRSPKPILQNVKFEASGDIPMLIATDLEVGIRVNVNGVEIHTPGTVLLPVGRFGAILRESNDDSLEIIADPQGTLVRGARSEYKLPGENPAEFPTVASFNEEKFLELPGRVLHELIRRTLFATDNESSRYALGGVLLEMTADHVIAVGTDGRRLAKMEAAAKSAGGLTPSDQPTIVPAKALQLIDRTLGDDDVQIAARANDVLIRTPRATIYSRLVEGRFPKWRDVFPRRPDATKIDLPVGPFFSAVRQAAIVTSEESKGIDFSFAAGTLTLTGRAAETGQSRVEMPVTYDGAELGITLDPKFVADFLKVLDPEKTIILEIKNSEGAAVFSTDDGYGYVVMPLARDR